PPLAHPDPADRAVRVHRAGRPRHFCDRCRFELSKKKAEGGGPGTIDGRRLTDALIHSLFLGLASGLNTVSRRTAVGEIGFGTIRGRLGGRSRRPGGDTRWRRFKITRRTLRSTARE